MLAPEDNTAKTPLWQRPVGLVCAFVLGAVLAALIVSAANKGASTTAPAVDAPAASVQKAADVDIATTFPSWDPQSASLAELVSFVQGACDPESPSYIQPADRIATFDMDGTIISEKAPMYLDYMLLIHRVLDDPNHVASDADVAIIEQVRDYAYQGKKNSDLSADRHRISDAEFAGMKPEEFRSYVSEFLDTVDVLGFDGMTYGGSFYKPMLEVIDYLRANDFDVWMVSACNREIVRGVVARLGIEPDHVIGADIAYATTDQGEQDPADFNMGIGADVVLSTPLADDCEKANKALAIARGIGKRPILAFGNSSGDYSMLTYAETSGGMGMIVIADDVEREYGNEKKAAETAEEAAKQSWTTFSMRDDWETIYGENVVKTELPAQEELAAAA